jgi:hypothetical protein
MAKKLCFSVSLIATLVFLNMGESQAISKDCRNSLTTILRTSTELNANIDKALKTNKLDSIQRHRLEGHLHKLEKSRLLESVKKACTEK